MTNPEHLHDVAELVTANTRLSEVLARTQSELIAKADSFNTGEAASWRRVAHWMMAFNIGLLIIGFVLGYLLVSRMDAVEASSQTAMKEALEANTRARAEEGTRTKFQEQQIRFNATVTEALEELSK